MFTYKTLIRDNLVDNATVKGLFNAGATGSCRVNMANLYTTGQYPQILLEYDASETRSNLSADAGRITLTIESLEGSGIHPHKELGQFRSAILGAIDDTAIQSNTAVCYMCRKFSEIEGYDESKKVYWLRLSFDTEFRRNTSFP